MVHQHQTHDHVMYRSVHSTEIDAEFDFEVIDLIETVRKRWNEKDGAFPGEPYDHDRFRAYYTDHHPVVSRLKTPSQNDD